MCTTRFTGSGGGQASGQYEVDSDTRIRWPGGKACAQAFIGIRTVNGSPTGSSRGRLCPSRWVRFSRP